MRITINTCKDCENRYPGCHGHCEKYQKARAEYDELKEAERKQKEISFGITAQRNSAVTKANRKRRNSLRNIGKGRFSNGK